MSDGCTNADKKGKEMPDTSCDPSTTSCPGYIQYKLVSITVIANATQENAIKAKNWAAIKKSTEEIIIEAITIPNDQVGWEKINWSGDSGSAVPGHLNQRKLSKTESKKLHIEAELGGVKDYLDVWVIWAAITIQISGTTPKNSKQFKDNINLENEELGAVYRHEYWEKARGKIAAIAQITPSGINKVFPSDWSFKRDRISHDWINGEKRGEGNGRKDGWNTKWVDDTSFPAALMLVPTNDSVTGSFDQIFDIDGPNTPLSIKDSETYNNFRQWIAWRNEKCSEYAEWYWKATWRAASKPQITLNEVGRGNITLPSDSPLHSSISKPKK